MKSLLSRFRTKEKETPAPGVAGPSRPPSRDTLHTPPISRRQSVNHDPDHLSPISSPALGSDSTSRPGSPRSSSPRPPSIPHRSSSYASAEQSRPSSALGPSKLDIEEESTMEERQRTLSAAYLDVMGAGGGKKVTFRSPVPTPPSSALMDDIQQDTQPRATSTTPSTSSSPVLPPPLRQSMADRQRPNTLRKHSLPPLTSIRPIHPSSSSYRSPSPIKSCTFGGSGPGSLMSPTPSTSVSMASETSLASTQSYLAQPNSWSEMAEEELIANLGPRERTRQEVLWEIVSSEERYVQELIKLNDTFCRALLPPSAHSPTLTLHDPLVALSRTLSPSSTMSPSSPSSHDSPNLPIAARYSRSTSTSAQPSEPGSHTTSPTQTGVSARLDAYNKLTNGRPTNPAVAPRGQPSLSSMRDKAKAHQSLPPLSRGIPESRSGGSSKGWSGSFARLSHPAKAGSTRIGSGSSLASIAQGLDKKDVILPDELAQVLAVLSGGILEGHLKLAAALRRRYEDQYPLVRSLADVFTAHSYILREYATYILHLESALSTIDSALSLATRPPRRHSRQLDHSPELTLGKTLLGLEELATERGESGLAISLSKPFQRLLKYPLLFQNLLFNTDPSLREYEATLAMVDEVEMIVRGIEDEKVSKEESERTRDVWARIEGLEADKVLMAPKASRLVVDETQLSVGESAAVEAGTKSRKSKHRLSDMLKKPEKAEYWIVRFSDVSLLCEKTGSTQLPISSTKSKRESMPEMGNKGKYATVGKRHQSIRARNLYRFVKVHEWHLRPKTGSTDALLSMEEISRVRSAAPPPSASTSSKRISSLPAPASPRKAHSRTPSGATPSLAPSRVPIKTEDGPTPSPSRTIRPRPSDTDTVVSDRMSVMSFAFNGGDQVRPTRLRPKSIGTSPTGARTLATSQTPTKGTGARAPRPAGGNLQGKAADAKFAHRLRSTEVPLDEGMKGSTVRPSSESAARRSLPPAMMRSAVNGAATVGKGRPLALNPQALDRVHSATPPAPLSPKNRNGMGNGGKREMSGTAGKVAEGAKVERTGSVSSRRTMPRRAGVTGAVGVAVAKEGVGARTGKAGRGGMI